MTTICPPELCTACGACMQSCMRQAIRMCKGDDGFIYPVIEKQGARIADYAGKIVPQHSLKQPRIPDHSVSFLLGTEIPLPACAVHQEACSASLPNGQSDKEAWYMVLPTMNK